jgi:hypothetical protein
MLPRHLARTCARLVVTTFVLGSAVLFAGPASAQKPLPPTRDELVAQKPWHYWLAWALLAGCVLMVAAFGGLYLLKSREFKANQRRGGAK